jgi:hypothetical protein
MIERRRRKFCVGKEILYKVEEKSIAEGFNPGAVFMNHERCPNTEEEGNFHQESITYRIEKL